jgi:acetate CoA/acetoacetate CoA-transferase alpha subunit
MKSIISAQQAATTVHDGMTIMIGGFLANGTPETIIDAIIATQVKNLTLICNDTSYPDRGVGRLVAGRRVKKLITSHIGTNPASGAQLNAGEIEIEFCPQGSLAERIRAGGNGLGGILTPTGLGTLIARGKRVVEVDGREYLLETPLRADVAFIGASVGDRAGNLVYRGTSQNFNPLMATAADVVIAEVAELVDPGTLHPESIHTPGILVDHIVHSAQLIFNS